MVLLLLHLRQGVLLLVHCVPSRQHKGGMLFSRESKETLRVRHGLLVLPRRFLQLVEHDGLRKLLRLHDAGLVQLFQRLALGLHKLKELLRAGFRANQGFDLLR